MLLSPLSSIQEVDLHTVKPEDVVSFSSPYTLVATRDDYIDALVAYFTVEFSKCHKRTAITTGMYYMYMLCGVHVHVYRVVCACTCLLCCVHVHACCVVCMNMPCCVHVHVCCVVCMYTSAVLCACTHLLCGVHYVMYMHFV